MSSQHLTHFLASLPPSGGRAEQLRQERILNSTASRAKSIAESEQSEMEALQKKAALTPPERIRLEFLLRKFPSVEGPSLP
jgi:hypothetical protein